MPRGSLRDSLGSGGTGPRGAAMPETPRGKSRALLRSADVEMGGGLKAAREILVEMLEFQDEVARWGCREEDS